MLSVIQWTASPRLGIPFMVSRLESAAKHFEAAPFADVAHDVTLATG